MDKIKWDKRIDPEHCTLYYWDRICREKIKIKYGDVKNVEDNIMEIKRDGRTSFIPLHRLRKIKNKGRVIWERKKEE